MNSIQAQITVSSSDFVSSGDIVRFSVSPALQSIDYQSTGAGYTWNYATLTPTSQRLDTFLSIFSTSFTYYAYFNLPAHKSNLAVHGPDIPTSPGVPVTITNTYGFFNKSSSEFEQTGFGAEVNGLSTPVGFNRNDVIYRFPLQYGAQDSSSSDFDVTIPGVGSYSHQQKRRNYVDGWGTLTTPFGTFQVLRIVSEIYGNDSVYSSTYNQGIRLPASTRREYKWISNGHKLPLLQVNTTVNGSIETITTIEYQDIDRNLPNSVDETNDGEVDFTIFPNPADQYFYITIPKELTRPVINITDMTGRIVRQIDGTKPTELINKDGLPQGIYLVRLQSGNQSAVNKLVIR